MSSKRALYKPSPQSHVGQKSKSCLLAQGRLVTDASLKTAPHKAGRSASDGDGTSVVQKQDPAGTPRKNRPHLLESHSPRPGPPADNLDLSDSDIDFPHLASLQSNRSRRSEVLVMDASRKTTEPASAEVEVSLGYEQSPVRVVCHSPGRNKSLIRDASEGLDRWTVRVEGVPKVSFLESSEHHLRDRPRRHDTQNQEDQHSGSEPVPVVSHGHRGHVETSRHMKTGREIHVDTSKDIHVDIGKDIHVNNGKDIHVDTGKDIHVETGWSRPSHYPQPNFDDSSESGTSERITSDRTNPTADYDDARSVTSESDVCSLQDFFTRPKPRIVSKEKKPGSAKKKTGRFVPSRYMKSSQLLKHSTSVLNDKRTFVMKNQNQNHSGPVRVTERFGSRKDNSLPHKISLTQTKPISRSGHPSLERPASVRKTKPIHTEERPETPVVLQKDKDIKTSTPTHDMSSMLLHDASAIDPENSILTTGEASHSRLQNKGSAKKKEKKKSEHPVSLLTLKLTYARYLQSLFLDVQAKKYFKINEKKQMAEMQALWESLEEKRNEEFELRKEISRLKHNILLDEQLELQEAGLEPIVSNLSQLRLEHKSLADSLDTTRHQIRTKGIYLPDDEDQYQAMFESALLESEQLLGELSSMTRTETPHVTDLATSLQETENLVGAECKEIARCSQLVSAIQTLSTEENSLTIHALQRQ